MTPDAFDSPSKLQTFFGRLVNAMAEDTETRKKEAIDTVTVNYISKMDGQRDTLKKYQLEQATKLKKDDDETLDKANRGLKEHREKLEEVQPKQPDIDHLAKTLYPKVYTDKPEDYKQWSHGIENISGSTDQGACPC